MFICSVNEILQDRVANPFQILSNLGFGSTDQGDELTEKIPLRFLKNPSRAKGIEVDAFLEKHPILKDHVECHESLVQPFSATHIPNTRDQESSDSSGVFVLIYSGIKLPLFSIQMAINLYILVDMLTGDKGLCMCVV